MSFAEKFAVLIVSHPRNFIQPHWEVKTASSSSHTVLEGIDKFESGLNKSIYTKYSIKFCIDSGRKIYLKPALRIMAT
jgi:hypothetical protein